MNRVTFSTLLLVTLQLTISIFCSEQQSIIDTTFESEFVKTHIKKKCEELRQWPAIVCPHSKRNIGIATEKELPHIALIHLRPNNRTKHERTDTKCVGSLISDQFVLTSASCFPTSSENNDFTVIVHLGALTFNSSDDKSNAFLIESFSTKYDLSLIKLQKKVNYSDHIFPICLFTDTFTATQSYLLSGWTGNWLDCSSKLKKWVIDSSLVKHQQVDSSVKINNSSIINYHESLMNGSPLQIYHPDGSCQYSLIALFEGFSDDDYKFKNIQQALQWIDFVVWPKRVNQMSLMTYKIMKRELNCITKLKSD